MAEDLKKFLDGYSGKLVAPAGFDDRLEKVCNKDGDPIDQALFNVGFQAWFAYVLAEASPENAALVKGIKNLQDTELSSAALEVQHHVTPSSIGSLYDHLFNSSSRGYGRKSKYNLKLA